MTRTTTGSSRRPYSASWWGHQHQTAARLLPEGFPSPILKACSSGHSGWCSIFYKDRELNKHASDKTSQLWSPSILISNQFLPVDRKGQTVKAAKCLVFVPLCEPTTDRIRQCATRILLRIQGAHPAEPAFVRASLRCCMHEIHFKFISLKCSNSCGRNKTPTVRGWRLASTLRAQVITRVCPDVDKNIEQPLSPEIGFAAGFHQT